MSLQHETASLAMFDYLVEDNDLKPVMEEYGLVLPEDLVFIKEQIGGPQVSIDSPSRRVCTLTLPAEGYVLGTVWTKMYITGQQ